MKTGFSGNFGIGLHHATLVHSRGQFSKFFLSRAISSGLASRANANIAPVLLNDDFVVLGQNGVRHFALWVLAGVLLSFDYFTSAIGKDAQLRQGDGRTCKFSG